MERDLVRAEVVGAEVVGVDVVGGTDVARSDLISWSSIVAGVLSAFAIFVLLSALSVAAGLEADPPKFGEQVGGILTGIFGVVAFAAGGFIAAWTARVDERDSAIMHGFLVWALFVVLLLALIAMGLGTALGSVGNVFSGAFDAPDEEALSNAAWGSVFALAIAVASTILGALLATRDEVRSFARRY